VDRLEGYVDLDVAAKRMRLTVDQVLKLVERRVLRGVDLGYDVILVEPAILSGSIYSR
jgi:hypothetical protein